MNDYCPQKALGSKRKKNGSGLGKGKSDDISPFGSKWAEIKQKYPLQKKSKIAVFEVCGVSQRS